MKKMTALVLLMVALCNVVVFPALASNWVTGNFGPGYTTVYLSSPDKPGYIRIHTYSCNKADVNHTGKCSGSKEFPGKITVTLCDTHGNRIISFPATGGEKLCLGNDHPAYRVYISVANSFDHFWDAADNFLRINDYKHWAIETGKNTEF